MGGQGGALTIEEVRMRQALMQLPPLRESDARLLRSLVTSEAERIERRIGSLEERIPALQAELAELQRRRRALIGEEGRPGLVLVLNEQLDAFDDLAPSPSASRGRRGHAAPLRAVPVAGVAP